MAKNSEIQPTTIDVKIYRQYLAINYGDFLLNK